jgi:hypothetical protein
MARVLTGADKNHDTIKCYAIQFSEINSTTGNLAQNKHRDIVKQTPETFSYSGGNGDSCVRE